MKYASAIIAPTESVRKYLYETERIPLNKIRVIYHGVDLEKFNMKFSKLGKTIYVGSLGRFRPEKGQNYIIQALPKVLRGLSPKKIEMHFAGEGPSLEQVRRQAQDLGVSKNVRFLGSIYDVPKFLSGINILVHAAVSGEAFCYAALEGLAAGRAVVVTNTDGIPEYVKNNYNGILIPIESPESIADAIVGLATDPAMYLRICKNAVASCRPFFSKTRMINHTLELYKTVITRG
jgi:glycosyltransferase involved in cell wall biosynthesis